MPINYVNGNLLESNCKYICHQVNCQGKMNSGIAKGIRNKWPNVYIDYRKKYEACSEYPEFLLGSIQICALYNDYNKTPKEERKCVINMFSQFDYGYDGKRYTSYEAFINCLEQIARSIPPTPENTIGFPYGIGCVRGGARWDIIQGLIEIILKDHTVYIYKLEE